MPWPKLPSRAAYLVLDNANRRNALSLAVLRDLNDQLHRHNTAPSGNFRVLPPFRPDILNDFEAISNGSATEQAKRDLSWLVDGEAWWRERHGLPCVIVLRSEGPVFSSGHDLAELRSLSHEERRCSLMGRTNDGRTCGN